MERINSRKQWSRGWETSLGNIRGRCQQSKLHNNLSADLDVVGETSNSGSGLEGVVCSIFLQSSKKVPWFVFFLRCASIGITGRKCLLN